MTTDRKPDAGNQRVRIGDWKAACVLFGEGVLCLLLAAFLVVCLIPGEEEPPPAVNDLSSVPNFDYIGEVVRLRSESADEAKMLAKYIFETEGMPNQAEARQIYDEIERDQKHWWNRTKRVAWGFVTGDGGSIEELGGSVVSDMVLYGDIRDLIKHSYYKVTKNEKGDAFIITLSSFGLLTELADVVDWAPAVLKAFRKAGALSEKMVGLLSDGMKKCIEAKKIDSGLASLFSGIKSMSDSLGFACASRVMRHADDAADVAVLAKAAKMAPDETYLLVKYSGRGGIKELENLTEVQVKALREAAKKGPDVLKNFKKYGNELKRRTSSARRLARLVKSWRSGHLPGLVTKILERWPFLRFVFGGLALILAGFCGLKFRQAVRRCHFRPGFGF